MSITSGNFGKPAPKEPKKPDDIDIMVGKRLRAQRASLGISQEQLAKKLGISFQQIQKYEHGNNRISSSRLFQIGKILGVTPQFFFDPEVPLIGKDTYLQETQADQTLSREALELVRAYYKITSAKQRKRVYELIKTFSDA